MRIGWLFAVALGLVVAACGGQAAETSRSGPGDCGAPGQPPCPLQAWMRTNVGQPLTSNDFEGLALGLEKAARLSPVATWTSWARIANEGAEAARKRDLGGARAACNACHGQFRDVYKTRFRDRSIPR
jgi:hypothetical protein